MYEFSAADGFVEITESLGEMIKYLANEPSVGLYYIQQHVQNAVPNVIHLKNNVLENSRETILHSEDLEDSISAIGSMKECGFPIAEEMIRDIKRSMNIISTKQPVRGLIRPTSASSIPSFWSRSSVEIHGEKAPGYLSNVLKTARQKAESLKWPQLDLSELREMRPSYFVRTGSAEPGSGSDAEPGSGSDAEPGSDAIFDDELRKDGSMGAHNYDIFKADREAELEEWLETGVTDQRKAGRS